MLVLCGAASRNSLTARRISDSRLPTCQSILAKKVVDRIVQAIKVVANMAFKSKETEKKLESARAVGCKQECRETLEILEGRLLPLFLDFHSSL
jgi:hypothetical protein